MPFSIEISILSPWGVKAFWWKYRLAMPGASEMRITRWPVRGSTHSFEIAPVRAAGAELVTGAWASAGEQATQKAATIT